MIDFNARLAAQEKRRSPRLIPGMESITSGAFLAESAKRNDRPALKYITEAMSEIPTAITKKILGEGINTANDVISNGIINASIRPQGSVPLNIHIESASDVDILIIAKNVIATDNIQGFRDENGRQKIETELLNIRKKTLLALKNLPFNIENNNKSIKLSSNSAVCDIDIVPACWFDTKNYQSTKNEVDRGVLVMDRVTLETNENFPFKYIDLINNKDLACNGNAKKIIRLLKTIKADSPNSKKISLSSYDIASLVYTMEDYQLNQYKKFKLLAETYKYMAHLKNNPLEAKALKTPDRTRVIFNTEEKLSSLTHLINELITISEGVVATEKLHGSNIYESLSSIRETSY